MSAGFVDFGTLDYMAYAGQVPWHGLGEKLEGLATASQMIAAAHLDWTVGKRQLAFQRDNDEWVDVPGSHAVIREDYDIPLGVVGERYTVIQNEELFSFFDNIVEEGEAIYETAGSLHGGKKTWILAKLPKDQIIYRGNSPDVTQQFILITNSHDGTAALRCYFTPVRVVCQNTLTASGRNSSNKISIRHTTNAAEKLAEAHKLMEFTTLYYEEIHDTRLFLNEQEITDLNSMLGVLDLLYPQPKKNESKVNNQHKLDTINLYGQETKKYGPTWLSFLDAVTGHIDHEGKVNKALEAGSSELRMDNLLFGAGARKKEEAFELICKAAGYKTNKKVDS